LDFRLTVPGKKAIVFAEKPMNDNTFPTSREHAEALALIADLQLILAGMHKAGLDRLDENGERVFQPDFWAGECAKLLGMGRMA
jgi:hypothetical protein